MRLGLVCLLALVVSSATGCSKMWRLESKRAIQEAIEAHIRRQPNLVLANMTLEVQDVEFRGDKAGAQVQFQSKQSPNLTVSVHYWLRKVGDHWEVLSSSTAGGMKSNPHTSAAPTPLPPSSAPAPEASH